MTRAGPGTYWSFVENTTPYVREVVWIFQTNHEACQTGHKSCEWEKNKKTSDSYQKCCCALHRTSTSDRKNQCTKQSKKLVTETKSINALQQVQSKYALVECYATFCIFFHSMLIGWSLPIGCGIWFFLRFSLKFLSGILSSFLGQFLHFKLYYLVQSQFVVVKSRHAA